MFTIRDNAVQVGSRRAEWTHSLSWPSCCWLLTISSEVVYRPVLAMVLHVVYGLSRGRPAVVASLVSSLGPRPFLLLLCYSSVGLLFKRWPCAVSSRFGRGSQVVDDALSGFLVSAACYRSSPSHAMLTLSSLLLDS